MSSSISGDVWSELEKLRNEIERGLVQRIPGIRINCQDSPRVPGGSNFTIPGVDAEMMVANLDDIVISTGSACKSGAPSPSHVLEAIGISREDSYCTLRFCLGPTILEHGDGLVDLVVSDVARAFERIAEA